MATHTWDTDGGAHEALTEVIKDYGEGALSTPQILTSLLKDLMPDSPRQSSVLVSAAEADIAGLLKERVAQHISTDAAVAQAAAALEERTGLTADACRWAARQLADALGLQDTSEPAPPEPVTKHEQAPPTTADPPHPPRPADRTRPSESALANAAAAAAALCAVSLASQTVAPGSLSAGYVTDLTLFGLILVASAALAYSPRTRAIGAGLIFGTSVFIVSFFAVQASDSYLGKAYVACSLITVLLALASAVAAAMMLPRKPAGGWASLRNPLPVLLFVAAIAVAISDIPGDLQYKYGSSWLTDIGALGSGVTRWGVLAGIVAVIGLAIPVLAAGMLAASRVAQAILGGWLAIQAASMVGVVVIAGLATERTSAGFTVTVIVWLIVAVLGIGLALRSHAQHPASSPAAEPTVL